MKTPRLTSELSKAAVFIKLLYRTNESAATLACASGVLCKIKNRKALVTNWHNLTGRRNDTLELLDKKYAAVPNFVKVCIPLIVKLPDGRDALRFVEHEQNLYKSEIPQWLEHPDYRRAVDVAALPLSLKPEDESSVFTLDDAQQDKINAEVGMDCFITGFPLGISGPAKLPIWKRASIATEPDFDIDGLPKILVDTATRKGLSGSPAHIVFNGYVTNHGAIGFGGPDTTMGQHTRFLGIYSGRVGNDRLGAQLGIIWKAEVVKEILEAGVTGDPTSSL